MVPSSLVSQRAACAGGTTPPGSHWRGRSPGFGVLHRAIRDQEFNAAIGRSDSIILVKGARQMGKTSLLARGLQQAREAGAQVILTDFARTE